MKNIVKYLLVLLLPVFIYCVFQLVLCKYLDSIFEYDVRESSIPIEVVFVATDKDFETLSYAVHSVRKYLRQPISKVVLISPKTDRAERLAKELNMEYIDEASIFDVTNLKRWIVDNNLKLGRHMAPLSWYYQQFLKLFYHRYTKSDYYLVVDADVVIQRPFVMVADDQIHTFFAGNVSQGIPPHDIASLRNVATHDALFKRSTSLLLGEDVYVPKFSYIAHLMCFNRDMVVKMMEHVERNRHAPFYKAVILAEQDNDAVFSEYQLYGTYCNFVERGQASDHVNYSVYVGNRYLIWADQINSEFKKMPYIAYHNPIYLKPGDVK